MFLLHLSLSVMFEVFAMGLQLFPCECCLIILDSLKGKKSFRKHLHQDCVCMNFFQPISVFYNNSRCNFLQNICSAFIYRTCIVYNCTLYILFTVLSESIGMARLMFFVLHLKKTFVSEKCKPF